jgi:hypothetical protein
MHLARVTPRDQWIMLSSWRFTLDVSQRQNGMMMAVDQKVRLVCGEAIERTGHFGTLLT